MSFVEVEFDEFDSWDKTATKFKKTICTFEMNLPDSFYNAILYGLIFKLSKDEQGIDKSRMLQIVGKYFLKNYMIKKKCSSLICLCNFEKRSYVANQILMEKKLFLSVYKQHVSSGTSSKKVYRVKINNFVILCH